MTIGAIPGSRSTAGDDLLVDASEFFEAHPGVERGGHAPLSEIGVSLSRIPVGYQDLDRRDQTLQVAVWNDDARVADDLVNRAADVGRDRKTRRHGLADAVAERLVFARAHEDVQAAEKRQNWLEVPEPSEAPAKARLRDQALDGCAVRLVARNLAAGDESDDVRMLAGQGPRRDERSPRFV